MNILKIKLLDKDLKTLYSKKANVEGDELIYTFLKMSFYHIV